ncbi:hypothetical protein ES702_04380 [subsurface metagenome]
MDARLKSALTKSARAMSNSLPILVGVVLLVGLTHTLIPKFLYFSKNTVLDSIIGSGLGSVLAGNPLTSYVLGGELVKQGVSLVAVTSFLVAWVTVGLVQLPAEAIMLGRKFAILRNIFSFVFSIIVAIITVFILGLI